MTPALALLAVAAQLGSVFVAAGGLQLAELIRRRRSGR